MFTLFLHKLIGYFLLKINYNLKKQTLKIVKVRSDHVKFVSLVNYEDDKPDEPELQLFFYLRRRNVSMIMIFIYLNL